MQHYLDKTDAKFTGNLCKHARACWGVEIVEKADEARDISSIRAGLAKAQNLTDGSITASFERKRKDKVTVSTHQHTYKETQ